MTDERPTRRSPPDDDAAATERVEAAHRRSPFGFQLMRDPIWRRCGRCRARRHVVTPSRRRRPPRRRPRRRASTRSSRRSPIPWHARYVGVVLDAASVSSLHAWPCRRAIPPLLIKTPHAVLRAADTEWLPLLGTSCALRASTARFLMGADAVTVCVEINRVCVCV